MRKIVISEMITLDGIFAGPNGEIDWFLWNEEIADYAIDLMKTVDTLLFGRVTYEMMAGYWPTASPPAEDPAIIEKMNNSAKIVFSKSLERADWNNTRLVKEIATNDIVQLKKQPGRDMVIYGSGSVVSALMNLGLIDEYHIFVHPGVLGSGKPLFRNLRDRHTLDLITTKEFSNGVVLHHYRSKPRE